MTESSFSPVAIALATLLLSFAFITEKKQTLIRVLVLTQ